MKRIDLIDEFSSGDWDNAILLTYTHDLMFFERELLRRLRENGCRNIALLVDEVAHQETFYNSKNIKLVGREYVIQTIKPGFVFHPKLYVFTNATKCKIILGSGNLTIPGFFINKEVFACNTYNYDNSNDMKVISSVLEIINTLSIDLRFRNETMVSINKALDKIPKNKIEWKSEDLIDSILLHNYKRPLLMQLKELIDEQINNITVISPFFDSDHRILKTISNLFGIKKISIIIQNYNNNFNVKKFKEMVRETNLKYDIKQIEFINRNNYRNHAKIMCLHSSTHDYLIWGSANFTSAALNKNFIDGNFETVFVQKMEKDSWKKDLFDESILIRSIIEKEIISISSDSYEHFAKKEIRLNDIVLNENILELYIDTDHSLDTFTLIINNSTFYKIDEFIADSSNNEIKIYVDCKSSQIVLYGSIFIAVEIEVSGKLIRSNSIWLNRPIDLEKIRTNEDILKKRMIFKSPDFSSREKILSILDYILSELKLEAKDLPKPVPKVNFGSNRDAVTSEEPDLFPIDNVEIYEEWRVDPLIHLDYQLYNQYVHAIYDDIGLFNYDIYKNEQNINKDKTFKSCQVLSNEDKDRIKDRFKNFIKRFIRGISNEEYISRVGIESVLFHYSIITSSLMKLIHDNPNEKILDFEFIKDEYYELHKWLIGVINNKIDTLELEDKFKNEVLPVVLADLLADYYQFSEQEEVRDAAQSRELLKYYVQFIDRYIFKFKHIINNDLIGKIMIFIELFGGIDKSNIERIQNLLNDSFGYIEIIDLENKISAIPGIEKIEIKIDKIVELKVFSKCEKERLNWIILSALYYSIITLELNIMNYFKIDVINTDPSIKRNRVISIFDKENRMLVFKHKYINGNEMYWFEKNVDDLEIKDNYKNNVTDIIKETKEWVPSEPLLSMLR